MRPAGDILVLDGDAATLAFIAEALGDEGYMIRTARYAEAALAAIQQRPPDLVILDLPALDRATTSLLAVLRESYAATRPIVAMTTNTKIAADLLALDIADCLEKPFRLDDLLDCVARQLRSGQQPAHSF